MPQIPDYQEKAKIDLSPADHIPKGIGEGGPEEAMQRAGAAMASIGDQWGKAIQDAQDVTALSGVQAQASQRLNELRNQYLSSEEFNTDPKGAMTSYQQAAQKMSRDLLEGMPGTSMKARAMAQADMDHMMARYNVVAADDVRRKQIDIARTDTLRNIRDLGIAVASAPNDQIAHDGIRRMYQQRDGSAASGVFTSEEIFRITDQEVKRSLLGRARDNIVANPMGVISQLDDPKSVYAQLDPDAKAGVKQHAVSHGIAMARELRVEQKEQEKQRILNSNQSAEQYLGQIYGLGKSTGDFDTAYLETQDPDKAARLGLLTPDQRQDVGGRILEAKERMRRMDREQQADVDKSLQRGVIDGTITGDQINSFADKKTGRRASPEAIRDAQRWLNSDESARNRTDYAAYTELRRRITTDDPDQITDEAELYPYYGNGVSKADGDKLCGLLHATQDQKMGRWFKEAEQAYKRRDETRMSTTKEQDYDNFITGLADEVQRDKLKGVEILKRAVEIMNTRDALSKAEEERQKQDKQAAVSQGGWLKRTFGGKTQTSQTPAPKQVSMGEVQSSGQPVLMGISRKDGVSPIWRLGDGRIVVLRGTKTEVPKPEEIPQPVNSKIVKPIPKPEESE